MKAYRRIDMLGGGCGIRVSAVENVLVISIVLLNSGKLTGCVLGGYNAQTCRYVLWLKEASSDLNFGVGGVGGGIAYWIYVL